MKLKNQIKNIINQLPYVSNLYQDNVKFRKNSCFPAGHFYSPIVSVEEMKKREEEIWSKANTDGIKGIDLRTSDQIKLLQNFQKYYDEMPFKAKKQGKIRYQFENEYYSYTDAIVLHSMIRHFAPKRIVEIGSGFSSAVMLDTNELFFDNKINLTFIEPYPERLHSIMKDTDKLNTTILQSDVQLTAIDNFQKLEAGDILFVDSTHVTKTGSDVNFVLFEILPSLQSGVLIHFHDIFYPFEYPKEWVFGGRNWNESYILKAFLMYNDKFEIELSSQYIHQHHKEVFKGMPLTYNNVGGNLWLRKK